MAASTSQASASSSPKASKIPERYLPLAMGSSLDLTVALIGIDRAKKRDSGLTVLAGPVGCGKTVALATWAYDKRASWFDAGDLALPLGWSASEVVREIFAPHRIAIDDIGYGIASANGQVLAHALCKRWADGRPTVISTNMRREDFAERLDGDRRNSRLLDRIVEDGEWVDCWTERSMRRPPDPKAPQQTRRLTQELAERYCEHMGGMDAPDGWEFDALGKLVRKADCNG